MAAVPEAVDPYDFADPEDFIGKMPKDFFERVVSSFVTLYPELCKLLDSGKDMPPISCKLLEGHNKYTVYCRKIPYF